MMKKGIIVSCQAETGNPFDNSNSILSFAKEAERGCAVSLRIKDPENIEIVKKNTKIPIIGLTKSYYSGTNLVLITPTFKDAVLLKNAGADYIAVDATGRNGYQHIKRMKSELDINIIGDLSNINEAEEAFNSGCSMFTTALSGYTEKQISHHFCEPDFQLLKLLVNNFNIPVLAEGRYWTLDHVKKAINFGAHAVVIGSAITRPCIITQYFNSVFLIKRRKNGKCNCRDGN